MAKHQQPKPRSKPATFEFSATQTKLIESFLRLAQRDGIASVTLDKVAADAKVAFGTVRYHFAGEGKLDLTQRAILYVFSLAQKHIEQYLDRARASPDFDSVESYVVGTFEWLKDSSKHGSFLLYFYYLSTTDMKLAVKNSDFLNTARGRIQALLYESAGRGQIVITSDTSALAMKIHALIVGGAVVALSEGTAEAFQTQQTLVLMTIKQLLLRTSEPYRTFD